MGKNNGSNNMPGWVKRDLQVLKRVNVSLIETVRETRREMAEMNHETRLQMVEMHKENQRRMAENESRMEDNETRIAQNEKMIAEVLRRNDRLEEQTTILKRSSDIHTKAILELLKKN